MAQHSKNAWSGIGYVNSRLDQAHSLIHTLSAYFNLRTFSDVLFAALLTQAVLPGGAMPFSVPFMAATLLMQKSGIPVLLGCAVGLLLRWEPIAWINGWQLASCVLLVATIRKGWEWKTWKVSLAAGAAMLLPMPFVIRQVDTLITSLSGGIAAGLLTPVFVRALLVFENKNQPLSNDDRLCCLLVASALSLGGLRLQVETVSFGIVIASFTVYVVAWAAGPGLSLPAGVLIGLFLFSSGSTLDLMTVLAVLGGMAGMLRDTRRYMPYVAGLLACALASFSQNGLEQVAAFSPSIAIGGFLFLIMPGKWIKAICGALVSQTHILERPDASAPSYVLSVYAEAMAGMARALPSPEQNNETQPVELLACRLCPGCDQQQFCWDAMREKTMLFLDDVLLDCAKDVHSVEIEQAARQVGCRRAAEVFGLATGLLSTKLRKEKENARRLEARAWALEQLKGQARALASLADRIGEDGSDASHAKEAICQAIPAFRSKPDAFTVQSMAGKLHVWFSAQEEIDTDRLAGALSEALRKPMERLFSKTSAVLFVEKPKLALSIGQAGSPITGEEVSGDSAVTERLDAGRYLLALSDGMGSGREASNESRAALELLVNALRAGYSRGDALRTVNGLLVACRGDEMFATMDLCVIDLESGEAALDKLGACPSFLLRAGKCKRIGSDSLPMGILEAVKPRALAVRMQPGDILLMVSDGVMDAFGGDESSFLRALGGLMPEGYMPNPQKIADTLLRRAFERCGAMALDDMTILAARIEAA